MPVEHQEGLERGMADALVAVREGVILNQRESQRRSLLGEVWIEICPAKRLAGQGDRGFHTREAADSRTRSRGEHKPAVKLEDLTEGEVSH
jgi:hypothetical protein